MFSLMTTPLTMNRFSNDIAPLMVMAVALLSWALVLGPVLKTPGAKRIVEFSERSDGSVATSLARMVVVTGAVCAKRSIWPVTVTVSDAAATRIETLSGTVCPTATLVVCCSVRKPWSSKLTV
jgi:hypothetical protein